MKKPTLDWRRRYTKYEVGDKVKCIKAPILRKVTDSMQRGYGWEEGKVFTIRRIQSGLYNGQQLLWGVDSDGGIYSDYVIKVEK